MEPRDALSTAAGVAGTGVAAKVGTFLGIAFLVCLLALGLLGGAGSGAAAASSCGERGTPEAPAGGGDGSTGTPDTVRKKQIRNAKVIDRAARDGGLSGRATLVGLMTALQESSLLNLQHGDRDSLGLFQQRPSAGWGSPAQLTDPAYASRMFFYGDDDGSPAGLTDVSGWERMPPGDAAQAVQRSAHPELYAGQQSAAQQIAAEAGISLTRAGRADASPSPGETPGNPDDCYPGRGKQGKPGEPFHDGAAGWPSVVQNPRSTIAAIDRARMEAEHGGKEWWRLCLAFVAWSYGWNASGVNYAIDHYYLMPKSMQHDKNRTPPPGALMYWETGNRAGHVAIYLGNGKIASNDIRRPGYIDVVDATEIESKWGATYVGWAPPYFPNGS